MAVAVAAVAAAKVVLVEALGGVLNFAGTDDAIASDCWDLLGGGPAPAGFMARKENDDSMAIPS